MQVGGFALGAGLGGGVDPRLWPDLACLRLVQLAGLPHPDGFPAQFGVLCDASLESVPLEVNWPTRIALISPFSDWSPISFCELYPWHRSSLLVALSMTWGQGMPTFTHPPSLMR
jgi:hypothetical protein